MARLLVEKKDDKLSIPSLVAAHLELETPRPTAPQCLKALTACMKDRTGNPALTIRTLKQSLRTWVDKGWATIDNNTLQVTRAGRIQVRTLADQATAGPTIQ